MSRSESEEVNVTSRCNDAFPISMMTSCAKYCLYFTCVAKVTSHGRLFSTICARCGQLYNTIHWASRALTNTWLSFH